MKAEVAERAARTRAALEALPPDQRVALGAMPQELTCGCCWQVCAALDPDSLLCSFEFVVARACSEQ